MRHIKLEIFDDAERCGGGHEQWCDGLRFAYGVGWRCLRFNVTLGGEYDDDIGPERCPECKAAEVTSD